MSTKMHAFLLEGGEDKSDISCFKSFYLNVKKKVP